MALFILTCLDKPGALELRLATRPDHLAHIARFGTAVKLAGPILSDLEGTPIGSHFVLDFADQEAAEAFASQDPYALAGVFRSRTLHPFRVTIGALGE
jgi:uncharacterized protein YciI